MTTHDRVSYGGGASSPGPPVPVPSPEVYRHPKVVRKGTWTDAEEALISLCVTKSSEQPFTRWTELEQQLPGRGGKQIRDRWVNHLNPQLNHHPFNHDDDVLLWDGHKTYGKKWVEISTKSFHSTRSENHIKNRWHSAPFKTFISRKFADEAFAFAAGDTTITTKASQETKDKSKKTKEKKTKVKDDPTTTKSVGV